MSASAIHARRPANAAGRFDCPACRARMEPFFERSGLAGGSSVVLEDRASALAFPTGDLLLGFCSACGFVANLAFNHVVASDAARCEDTQGYSATFSRFQQALAEDLVTRHALRSKRIVEIGCGQGEFLALLSELGANQGIGFDPEFVPGRGTIPAGIDAEVRREAFIDATDSPQADFVCCKMTLEHIDEVGPFVRNLRRTLVQRPTSGAYVLVPESLRILRDCAFEDIYYEHCSYFTPGSLARLFRSQQFEVTRLDVTYGGQYLSIEATPTLAGPDESPPLPLEEPAGSVAALTGTFAERFARRTREWRETLEERCALGPVALWGSGSKAVAFMHATGTGGLIEHIVDVNPYRQGRYVACTGQQILAPERLAALKPRTVIVMNRIYVPEISASLEQMGVAAEVLAL